ncbi:hypothetical protein PR202_gb03506 [Eleusine coracana subsp. coracana]|uniref:CCHC-type domain-containing protein n=1 Tax=Eleusine coracana subsp. coracana TaxID=191504 RepID=A0AAV5E1B1_ELECO|nr:hypothetical protein PR202_gb03506 [Eleusine coracana subsp. coracana]
MLSPHWQKSSPQVINRQQNEAELLRQLVENTSNLGGRGGNRNNNQPRQCTYSDFLGTHPPTFERAREPLDADHWLRQTESKFGLLDCTEHQKVLFAAQQLQGSASAWWANYEATLPAGRRLEWNEFKTAFRAHFIPAALMQRKLQEFTDLKQGGRNVLQYSEAFNHLAQYASEYVNTEEKKRYAFLRGMNAKLKERLTWQQTGTYNDLVNAAIVQEGAMRQVEEEDRKRKAPASASETPQAKHRLVFTSPTGQRYRTPLRQQFQRPYAQNYPRPPQQQNLLSRVPYQQQSNQYRAPYQQQGNPNARAPQPADRGGNYPCYNCGRTGHFAKNCTAPRRNNNNNINQRPKPEQKM